MRSLVAAISLILTPILVLSAQHAHAQQAEGPPAPGAAPAEAAPATTDSARAHFRLGVDFYRERNFRAALIEFQRAYADAPHYKLLYNLGQASLELGEYAGAIDYLTAYLEQGAGGIAEARRKEVEESLRYLESRIARVTISSNREGAEIYVDDTLVGRVPISEPLRVGAGRHKFTAVAEGAQPVDRMLDVAAQEQREVRLDFEDRQAAPAPPRVDTADIVYAEAPEGGGGGIAAAIATTATLGAGAVVMTVLSGLAQQAYDKEIDTVTTKARLDELRDDAKTKALITDIVWGATLVSGVVMTVLILTDDGDAAEQQAAKDAARTLGVSVSPTGIAVNGRF